MKETKWERIAVTADKFALPFWIVLIVYGLYEIRGGNTLGAIPFIIGAGAFIIDFTFVIKNRRVKN